MNVTEMLYVTKPVDTARLQAAQASEQRVRNEAGLLAYYLACYGPTVGRVLFNEAVTGLVRRG